MNLVGYWKDLIFIHGKSTHPNLSLSSNLSSDSDPDSNARLDIDPSKVTWHRVVDVNDRFLRSMTVGVSGKAVFYELYSSTYHNYPHIYIFMICMYHIRTRNRIYYVTFDPHLHFGLSPPIRVRKRAALE